MSALNVLSRALRAAARHLLPAPRVRLIREDRRTLDDRLLAGRRALVTGAGKNIGRHIALEMGRQGAEVYFTDVDPAAIARLESELAAAGARAQGFLSDISKPDEVEALCAALDADGITIDVLVNNVGISMGKGLRELPMVDLRRVFETNVFGPLRLTQRVVNALVAAGGGGSVLFLTSVLAEATCGRVAYSASKAALTMVVRELALELAPHRIRVNGIAPGGVWTNEADELPPFAGSALLGSCIHPSYVGRAAVYLAADHFSLFTTGSVLTVDAGMLTRRQDL